VASSPAVGEDRPRRRHLAARKALFAGRRATAPLRTLPDFLIIGAQRSGTTSLFNWLTSRPDVGRPFKKEVHYFDLNYHRGLGWYRSHFPIRRKGRISGESTPYLLLHPLAPDRAARDLPETRFVVVLREPVERAISAYWHRRQRLAGRGEPIDESLEEALERESEAVDVLGERVARGEVSLEHMAYSFVRRGEYAPQLERWFAAVGRDRVLVLEAERLGADPAYAERVVEWLGLPPRPADPFPVLNRAAREVPASPETVARLRDHFEPFNRRLFELLGEELWTTGRGGSGERDGSGEPAGSRPQVETADRSEPLGERPAAPSA